ncbi:MAG: DEAD/DEAH box helicase [Desulfomonile tiedjei]|nr:DEAD/DEAH box helicase [Desulfomonile tiedjei]
MLASFLEQLARRENFEWKLVHHEVLPAKPPEFGQLPPELHPQVVELIRSFGIASPYSHQAEAIRLSLSGKNVVLSTNTASGKTLAYQAPVIDRLIKDPEATALFLFPLKALERDQRDAFISLAGDSGLSAAVYDGDTPDSERRKIKSHPPRVLITNPDMLHLGLLAYHDSWKQFFGHLACVVLDEVHAYKGIFGSHISQVILRVRRVCEFYGSRPRFMACSATVANPGQFVSRLIGEDVAVVNSSGAPSSERHFLFVNPILSPYTVTARLFTRALALGLKTIVFTRARKITELITTWVMQESPHLRGRISSYRAGFLPEERREIETKLFSGKMDGVISTSALEMGIDVGGLDLCLLVGYPGTIINTWQRGGRVGRGARPSAIVLIAGNDALDQYFLRNPSDFFGRNCEEAILDPLNSEVLKRHIPCAAAERPIAPEEKWAQQPEVQQVLEELEEAGSLYKAAMDDSWHSVSRRPHYGVDLRSIGDSYAIFLEDGKTLIGSSSGARAFTECHEGAVYLHRAKHYLVTKLDLERRNVLVRAAKLQYYTRALAEKDTKILGAPIRQQEFPGFVIREARLKVTERIVAYEKRRTSGQEKIGTVDLDLPPLHFETVGIWIEIPDQVKETIKKMGLHFMGGIHAMEHAAISMFPLFALCDRDDIGGISTPEHEQVCRAAVFIYDGHPGGVGLAHRAFDVIEELLEKTRLLVEKCPCEDGCPSCIHSPKCGSGNQPLDKKACLATLEFLLKPEKMRSVPVVKRSSSKAIFPDLARAAGGKPFTETEVIAASNSREGASAGDDAEFASTEVGSGKPSQNPKKDTIPGRGASRSALISGGSRTAPTDRPVKPSTLRQFPGACPGRAQGPAPTSGSSAPRNRPTGPNTSPGLGKNENSPLSPRERDRVRALHSSQGPDQSEGSEAESEQLASPKKRIVVFDLETQKLAHEVGGWKNISAMRMSVGVTYSDDEGFLTFSEDNVAGLISVLRAADLVVGFNHIRFDYEVLRAYSSENLRALPNLDMLQEVEAALGHRLSLDHLAKFTLDSKKKGDGLDAARWFKEGKMDLLAEYCREDVRITRDLYLFGLTNGFLLYQKKDLTKARIKVKW